MNVFNGRRREPRVRLRTRAHIVGELEGLRFDVDVATIDLSPRGALITTAITLPVGTMITFSAVSYAFTALACVRNSAVDADTGRRILGIEFLGEATNPVVTCPTSPLPSRGRAVTRSEVDEGASDGAGLVTGVVGTVWSC